MAKPLTLSERTVIERMINADYTFASIARKLHRSASTISREVLKHRAFVDRPTPDGKDETKLLSLLKLQPVPPDEVVLKPALINHK